MKNFKQKFIDRVIDANINRAKEGLRVCEEITRFILDSRSLTQDLKRIRHQITGAINKFPSRLELLKQRDSLSDAGFNINFRKEFKRNSCQDIFFANIQRVKESVRVLEEFSKLKNTKIAAVFKRIRYEVYAVEKHIAQKYKFR